MENNVFVDSNFFIALYNPYDSLYKKAALKRKEIQKENPHLFISNFIFLEIVTVLSQRINKKTAVRLGRHLIDDKQIEIIQIDKELNESAWEIFQKIKNKNFSFVDASILAVMRQEEIGQLLTFDQEDFSGSGIQGEYHFKFY